MVMQDVMLSFVCQNLPENYKRGRLALPRSFTSYQEDRLPDLVLLHVDEFKTWYGRISTDRLYIEGLEVMMDYFLVKPYHLVLLQYDGYKKFKFRIFNPYAIEIHYPKEHRINHYASVCTDDEIESLSVDYNMNVVENIDLCSCLVLEPQHLRGDESVVIISRFACNRVGLEVSGELVRICYGKHVWHVELRWKDGSACFGKKWGALIRECGLTEGDTVCFYKSEEESTLNICPFRNIQKDRNAHVPDYLVRPKVCSSFFKVVTETVLRTGELVLPHVFSSVHGKNFGSLVRIGLGGGQETIFNYDSAAFKFHGLKGFFSKYYVDGNFILLFTFDGFSSLKLNVYDTDNMDHFRDLDGYYCFEDFNSNFCNIGKFVAVGEVVRKAGGTDLVTGFSSVESISQNPIPMEAEFADREVLVNGDIEFGVLLRKSHVNKRCHGAYLDRKMCSVTNSWNRRTVVKLEYLGATWSVEVLKSEKSCRFGIGWDSFIMSNGFRVNQKLVFRFVGNFHFNVTLGFY